MFTYYMLINSGRQNVFSIGFRTLFKKGIHASFEGGFTVFAGLMKAFASAAEGEKICAVEPHKAHENCISAVWMFIGRVYAKFLYTLRSGRPFKSHAGIFALSVFNSVVLQFALRYPFKVMEVFVRFWKIFLIILLCFCMINKIINVLSCKYSFYFCYYCCAAL